MNERIKLHFNKFYPKFNQQGLIKLLATVPKGMDANEVVYCLLNMELSEEAKLACLKYVASAPNSYSAQLACGLLFKDEFLKLVAPDQFKRNFAIKFVSERI